MKSSASSINFPTSLGSFNCFATKTEMSTTRDERIVCSPKVVLFLVAENCLLRETLVRVLRKKDDLLVTGACSFSHSVIDEIAAANPDLVLFDSPKVALSGPRAIARMRDRGLRAKIIMIGMEEDEGIFLRAVSEGVAGYVLEDAPAAENVRVIRAVAAGEAVCPARYSARLFECAARDISFSYNPSHEARFGLSRREQQLVGLIRLGVSNKEMADRLALSEQTIKNHIHRILRKVGASNRLDIVTRCQSDIATDANKPPERAATLPRPQNRSPREFGSPNLFDAS